MKLKNMPSIIHCIRKFFKFLEKIINLIYIYIYIYINIKVNFMSELGLLDFGKAQERQKSFVLLSSQKKRKSSL